MDSVKERAAQGLSERECFAAAALPALIARHRADVPWTRVAPLAFEIADEMVKTSGEAPGARLGEIRALVAGQSRPRLKHYLAVTLGVMRAARAKKRQMSVWDLDIKAVEQAIEVLNGIEAILAKEAPSDT